MLMASYPNKSLVIFSGIDNFRAIQSDYDFRLEKSYFTPDFCNEKFSLTLLYKQTSFSFIIILQILQQ